MRFFGRLSMLIAAVLSIGSVSSVIFTDLEVRAVVSEEGFTYSFDNGHLFISGTGPVEDYSGNGADYPWRRFSDDVTSVTVSEGITTIGSEAFYNMYYIQSVDLAPSVSAVEAAAFANCSSLSSFTAPGLRTVSSYAFQNTVINRFDIPAEMMSISNLAFYSADIGMFNVSASNPVFSGRNGVLFDKTGTTLIRFPNGSKDSEYEVPRTVSTINKYAFQGSDLENISLGNIIEIQESAFQGCSKLKSIRFPRSVKTIDTYAFYACSRLEKAIFNEGLININSQAFSGCKKLNMIQLPASTEFSHYRAFPVETSVSCKNTALVRYGGNGFRMVEDVGYLCSVDYDRAFELLSDINDERIKSGKEALFMNEKLMDYAMTRASETVLYPSDTRPDGSDYSTGFQWPGISVISEIITEGETSPATAKKSLFAEATDSLMSSDATAAGIGCVLHNGHMNWVVITGTSMDVKNCRKPESEKFIVHTNIAAGDFENTVALKIVFDSEVIEAGGSTGAKLCVRDESDSIRAVLHTKGSGILWTSSDPEIASVGSDGEVEGLKDGTCIISASTKNSGLKAEASVSVGKGDTVTMYRVFNPDSGEHLYTRELHELDMLTGIGWEYEGVAWYAPERSSVPVYRLFNSRTGDHHYTTDIAERNALVDSNWSYEGIGWYSDTDEQVPLYRLFHHDMTLGGHHYTTDENEKNALEKFDWEYEGIAWYGMLPPAEK